MLNITENGNVVVVVEAQNEVRIGGYSAKLTDDDAIKLLGIVKGMVSAYGQSEAPTEAKPQPTKDTKAATPAKPKASVKKSAKQTTAEPKQSAKASTPTVLRTDKYGNQWVAEYNAAQYSAKKAEMIANGTYDSKNRSAVYKALRWIL